MASLESLVITYRRDYNYDMPPFVYNINNELHFVWFYYAKSDAGYVIKSVYCCPIHNMEENSLVTHSLNVRMGLVGETVTTPLPVKMASYYESLNDLARLTTPPSWKEQLEGVVQPSYYPMYEYVCNYLDGLLGE